ncbi:MAG: Cell cycle serine/threonine-protein kinase cdc5/MSD2 [Trizodia sp. TS-e1964]|nr:MAG: Cell cycle serine/threonine-protein kinase cdc5/MSD2 [Trizodia sp. TS-e1964]
MEVLGVRSPNARIRVKTLSKKEDVIAKPQPQKQTSRVRDHPPAPPQFVEEPRGRDGSRGERYLTGKYLGRGGFAVCYEGELLDQSDRPTKYQFALKIVKAVTGNKKTLEKFKTELQIHSKMRHPNIVAFHRAFSFQQCTYIVLELCQLGSMMDMLKDRKYLTEPEVRFYTTQIAGAIKYMHKKSIIHRDLKLGNIFLDAQMNVKIGDFGLAALLLDVDEVDQALPSKHRRTTVCGTPNYIAPEILEKGKGGHDHQVDLWSLGVIIYVLLTGFPPFQSSTQEEIYRKVKERDYGWPSAQKCPNEICADAKELVQMLLVEAADRLSPDEVIAHKFFRAGLFPQRMSSAYRTSSPPWARMEKARIADMDSIKAFESLCKACEIGETATDSRFDCVSTYQQVLEEEELGITPQVPLPENIVYRSIESPDWPVTSVTSTSKDETDKDGPEYECVDLLELARQPPIGIIRSQYPAIPKISDIRRTIEEKQSVQSGNTIAAPRPETRSRAAQLREQARPISIPVRPRATSRDQSKTNKTDQNTEAQSQYKEAPGAISLSNGGKNLLNEEPIRSSRQAASRVEPLNGQKLQRSQSIKEGLARAMIDRIEQRNIQLQKSISTNTLLKQALESDQGDLIKEVKMMGVSEAKSQTTSRKPSPSPKVQFKQGSVVDEPKITKEPMAARTLKMKSALRLPERDPAKPAPHQVETLNQRKAVISTNCQSSMTIPKRSLIDPEEPVESLAGTKPRQVLRRLERLSRNLSLIIEGENEEGNPALPKTPKPSDHALVIKWVDYTNKFGIGYMLNDGTIGCLFNEMNGMPSTSVVVRGVESSGKKRELNPLADKQPNFSLGGSPIEFTENHKEEGLKRVLESLSTYKLTFEEGKALKLPEGSSVYSKNKAKMISSWRKFAHYMSDNLSMAEEPIGKSSRRHRGPFVSFYQRFGDVGVWGFVDGALQFNFPDHTKVSLSSDGTWCHFYYLPQKATKVMRTAGVLDNACLEERGQIFCPTNDLYWNDDPADIPLANHFQKKLAFIQEVVEEWVVLGGLGNVPTNERRKWNGSRERTKMDLKHVWVTVGARDGDKRFSETLRADGTYVAESEAATTRSAR